MTRGPFGYFGVVNKHGILGEICPNVTAARTARGTRGDRDECSIHALQVFIGEPVSDPPPPKKGKRK